MRETKSARLTRMHDEYDILRQVIPAPACALHLNAPLVAIKVNLPRGD